MLIAVPTHKLAKEAQDKMPGGVTTHVWQGRGGKHLVTKEPMCRNLEAVDAALEIGTDVENVACKRKQAQCPFYTSCHYQAQKPAAAKAEIVYVAHETLFNMPEALSDGFGLVIIDEAFWQDGLDSRAKLAISGLALELDAFPVRDHGWKSHEFTWQLRELIGQLQRALDQMDDGYVTRQPLVDAGLTAEDCAAAVKLEWRRKVDHGLRPGAPVERQKQAVKRFGFLAQLPAREAMWKALEDLLDWNDVATGRLWIETTTTKEGSTRWLRINRRKEIDKALDSLPTIVADATLPLELTRYYLPGLELALDLVIAEPHGRLIQAIGHPVGKSALKPLPDGKRTPAEEARVARKRARLVDTVRHLTHGRRGLAIVYKDIEKDFEGIDGVETGHFGAVEGIDRWGNVAVAVIIGRPMPKAQAIAWMAAAVTGRPVVATSKKCEREVCGTTIKCWTYLDPDAERVRAAIVEAAIEQARGRTRSVNRTAANPVVVYLILHDVVVPGMPVDEVVEFKALEPGAVDEMLSRWLVPQWPSDAAKLYPDLFTRRPPRRWPITARGSR